MAWMTRWPGSFPLFFDTAHGAHFTDVDGLDYIDFCLGDTGAMTGHGLPQVAEALYAQALRGITTMLPSVDAAWVGGRTGPAVRASGLADGDDRHRRQPVRPAVRPPPHRPQQGAGVRLVLSRHGRRDAGNARRRWQHHLATRQPRRGRSIRRSTTVVVPFNDLAALEAALATGEIACVLAEPALTNIGIVMPDPGFHDALRAPHPRLRHVAGDRRDAHHLRRSRRRNRGLGPRARLLRHRQDDRWRHAGGCLRHDCGDRRASWRR